MKKLVVIGSSNTDMVVKTSRFPKPGETILGGDFFLFPGGKGANQAVAAARLGGDVTFICSIGQDLFGDQAVSGYEKEGINTKFVRRDPVKPTGVALITVDASGENEIVVAPGSNALLSVEWLIKHQDVLEGADLLLTQLETPIDTILYLLDRYAEKLLLNPAPAAALPEKAYKNLKLITPNETEAGLLTGIEVKDLTSAKKAAESLLNKGCQAVIITLGAKGAFYHSHSQSFLVPAEKVVAVDTTAAGDVFNGALAVGLLENKSKTESVDFACKAAALSVQKMGAQASAPYLKQLHNAYS